MVFVTKFISATIKQKIDAVVKNPYFKFSANNINLFTLKYFFLEKINNNIEVDVVFYTF